MVTLGWIACFMALLGSGLIATRKPRPMWWGFALYLVSDIAWIAVGLDAQILSLVLMNLAFCATSIWGLRP